MARFPRRQFLELAVVSAGAPLLGVACAAEENSEADSATTRFFPQSIASGDPRPNSVVLWTRVVDVGRSSEDLELELELAKDPEFAELIELDGQPLRRLVAEAARDHCVRARIEGLTPGTTYHYRFRYQAATGAVTSRTGRTKTAPAEDSNQSIRFGVVCCQSYGARHYHVLWRLAQEELDFVVHLGDYVYETAGAPPYRAGTREVRFGRPEEALVLSSGSSLAALSLDNYRDLYRIYRSDPDLQALHERFAMIAIPDDHEFADDSHGATSTHFDGKLDETDVLRRKASDRAWAEYMPIDFEQAPAAWDATRSFPDDLRLYRSFVFGRHLTLIMTDLRRYRPDHLVREDAFPGSVFATEPELEGLELQGVELVPYIDIDAPANAMYRAALLEHVAELDFLPDSIQGSLSAPWINSTLASLSGELPPPIDVSLGDLPVGLAFHQLLKTAEFARLGSRYLVEEATYAVYAKLLDRKTGGESENLLGGPQREWFLDTLGASTSTFKIWCSEIVVMPRVVDLRGATALPEALQSRLVISAEDWGGFPNERDRLLKALYAAENSLILSGDLHCFFAGALSDPEDPARRVVEFTTSSVSSTTWLDAISSIASTDTSLSSGVAFAVGAVGSLLQDRETRPNPHLAFQDLEMNGCSVIEVGPEALLATLLMIAPEELAFRRDELPVGPKFTMEQFRVRSGIGELERQLGGVYYRWDPAQLTWTVS